MKDTLLNRSLKVAPVAALALAIGTMIANGTWQYIFILADLEARFKPTGA